MANFIFPSAANQQNFPLYTQAITKGSLRKLEDSVNVMKTHAGSQHPGTEKYLDVCSLQSVAVTNREKPILYYMTLLAYAAIHKRKGMIKYLLEKGASK